LSVASTSNTSKAQSIDEAGLEYDEDQDYSQVFANEDDENDSDMIDAESIQDNTLAPVENEDNSEEMVESDNPAQFVTQYEKNQTEYRKQNVSEILHDNTQAVVNEEIEEKCDEIHDNVFSATVEKIRTPMPMSWKNLFDQLDTRIKNLKARRDELVERAEERKKQKWQQENDFWSQALTLDVTQMPTSMNSTATSTA
jgi:DNA-binding transcriptional regulator YbjK